MFEGKDVQILLANAGTGKGNWVECKIPTPQGIRRFGDLKEGDYVFDRLGYPTKILKVYPRGFMDAYKVTLSDGRSTVVSLDHLWNVYRGVYSKKIYTLELGQMLSEGVRKEGNPKFYIPSHCARQYAEKKVTVDPYVYGAFIGNGCLTSDYLEFSSDDEETVNKDKYIPDCYKYNSIQARWELLRGLFDTDGSAVLSEGRLQVSYSTTSKRLAEDIKEVLNSLGIVSHIYKDGRNICYNVNVNTTKENKCRLFSLTRKKRICEQASENRRHYERVAIRSVEKLPEKLEINCIWVDNKEHLYQCDEGIVTHNTRRLIDEVSKELETRRPEELAFVTFTRKGAEEGLKRVCSKLMYEPKDLPYFKTLHSLTFHALNYKKNQMFGKLDQRKFNKEFGYNINRSEVDTGKVAPTRDTLYLDFYDMERSGALTSKQLVEADIEQGYYKQIVRDYEAYKERENKVDFFDCLIKYVEKGESLPVKVAMIDECQDITALQWKVIEKAFTRAEKIIIAGDDKQCQPTGSKVLTRDGYKNIEELTTNDSLITFAQGDYAYYGTRQKEYHAKVGHRFYKGLLYDVTVNGITNRFTPNHRMIVRWDNRDTSSWCVYFMQKKNLFFKLDYCKTFSDDGSINLPKIMQEGNADNGWILRIFKTESEAEGFASYLSFRYHILYSGWCAGDFLYPAIFNAPRLLLSYVNRNIDYPLFTRDEVRLSLCEACNLIPEIMSVPVYQGKRKVDKETLWHKFSVSYEKYCGLVYSLDVPKYHTYITDGGLTVHNSIYSYSGARPDFLIQLSKQFPVEHLSKSYRLPRAIYELSVAITNFIGEKTEQRAELRTENGEGKIMQLSELDRLLNFIDEDKLKNDPDNTEWYILCRNNCFLDEPKRILEEALIPYWTAEGFFMGGEIMKRLKDYENFKMEGYKDEKKKEDFQRKFGIEDFTQPFTETNLFTEGRKWVYASYIEKYGLKKLEEMCKWNPQILVSTIHHVKGGEAKNCAIMLDTTKRTKWNVFENIDEELRILYVGVTRAKENLFLIDSKNDDGYDNILATLKEQFGLEW